MLKPENGAPSGHAPGVRVIRVLGQLAGPQPIGSYPAISIRILNQDTAREILQEWGRKGTSALRASLIEKGVVYSAERGKLDFNVPRFAAFLRKTCRQSAPARTSPRSG